MPSPTLPTPADTPASGAETAFQREFLAFRLGREEYGIHILQVQEIRSFEKPTGLAHAPAELLGLVNLRGSIVPIFDLRVRLGLREVRYDDQTVVIVVHVGARTVGLVVDGVSDVVTLQPGQIRPVPPLNAGGDSRHLLGLGTLNARMLILLDINTYLAAALASASAPTLH